jgi:dihydrofolate reductase
MRRIVLQMMTTLNGRLDDPAAWVHGVSDEQYRAIDRLYATYDTVLVGATTYEEMAAYWPGALAETHGTETNRSMARRMRDYRKLAFSRSGRRKLTPWSNAELVVAGSDAELGEYLTELKAGSGGDIHLSGGAGLTQSIVGLGLVDEFHFFVYPAVSPGEPWFSRWPGGHGLRLANTAAYQNGVVHLHYVAEKLAGKERPTSFSELLT